MNHVPDYFDRYENFAFSRTANGVLTVRFHTNGVEHTFTGTTHHDFPRLVEDIAYDRDNKVLVLTGTGDTFIDIRSWYRSDPNWSKVQAYLNGGAAPVFNYHRFWAQADVAMANADYGMLFPTG